MTIAYIYKWVHLPTSKWYIGVRTKKGCHPDDGYICSSKIVKPLIESFPTEWQREILYTGTPDEMLKLESCILTDQDAKNNVNSYNLQNGDGNFTTTGITMPEAWVEKIRKGNSGKIRSEKARENYRRANQKKAQDLDYLKKLRKPKLDDHKSKISASLKGVNKTDEHKRAMSAAKKGKKTGPCSDARKEAIKKALKGKHTLPMVTCPHCGLTGRSNMKRWHFDNCKERKI
jgi:uncharacterized protein RhaS with RHS repeats